MPLPSLEYYDELYKKRKKPVATFDPLDAQLRQERDREIREGLFLSASPDTIARVNRVSRVTGEPPVLVEDRVDAYEKSITSDRFMGVVQEHPEIAKWAVNNPRGAAAAVDDSLSLAKFGKAFKDLQDDFLKDDGWLEQAGDFMTRRVRGIQGGFDRFAVATDDFFESLTPEAQKSAMAKASAPVRREKFKKRAELNEAIQASPIRNEVDWQSVKKNPTVGNIATYIRQQGASSIPDMVLAVSSLPIYTAGRSGEIGQERAKNSGRTEATIGDVATASPAALLSGYLDRLGVERLILPGADTVAKRIVKATAVEAGTEFAQEVIEYGGETIGTDVSFNPGEALDRGIAGAVGGAGMAAPIRTGIETPRIIEAVAPVVSKLLQSGNAKKEALFLDNVMKAAEKSKLRERDPDAFKEMLKGMAEENGASNVYVSGEALQSYMQSDSYDPDGPLSSWLDQIEEAAATGGDVLMPIEEAAVALQPAWATLKDDVRLSAGGVSRREAQTFDEAMADVMDELEKSMVEQEQATAKKLEPIEKLATSINQKLQNAGFTPSTAKIQADLLVQRYATRAERLGKQLTGNEFDVTVNNVLPEGLAAARNADNLDLVINSYFTMKNPKEQTGKSLIEWIAERGGVTDDGGDLKSMGLDKWHVGKFKKKALKSSTKGQGNMLGVSDSNYQPDRVLVSAIEAGYFPELDGSTELVDANVLLEAIGEELRGVPRYAQERIVDDVQQLAMQLDEYLGQAGFDTSNMTRDEMRAAIMQAQDAQLGGYTQRQYPLAPRSEWYGEGTYKDNGGRLVYVSPQDYLDAVKPLTMDDESRENIDNLKDHIESGKTLDPLLIRADGKEDGRHRAYAALELGIQQVPVIAYGEQFADAPTVPDARGLYQKATITIDGVERPTQNSNGQPLAQTEEGLRNFWAWFGDSKVVDAEGRPLVTWHGTTGNIDAFKGMAWGAQDVMLAREYAFMRKDMRNEPANILAIYMKAERVFDADALPKTVSVGSFFNEALQQAQDSGQDVDIEKAKELLNTIRQGASREESGPAYDRHDFWNQAQSMFGADGADAIQEMFKLLGFDGVQMRESATYGKEGEPTYGVFAPEQVKSTDNRGTFDPADARILYQPAYHGSPHIFDKFSLDAIGTGEGAQAYGYGLYFAGKKEIAEFYRNALSRKLPVVKLNGRTLVGESISFAAEQLAQTQRTVTREDLVTYFEKSISSADGPYASALIAEAKKALAKIQKAKTLDIEIDDVSGRLYEVDIPEDGEYLLWDAPLSEQPAKTRAAFEAALKQMDSSLKEVAENIFDDGDVNKLTGQKIYEKMKDFIGPARSILEKEIGGEAWGRTDAIASKLLHDAGIAGIKYLDGTSRKDGEGSYNYVVFDDNAVSIRAYEQSYEDNARGKITFNSGQATIDLFKTRNLSTFLHEVGHLWLEELRFDAELADAPAELKADWETVNKWFASQGYGSTDGIITTEAHEMWARGVERYLMEGKSPVPALKRIFETFRVWLTSIYKTVDALKSPITPEIRAVMDRLIATDDQLNDMVERQGIEALFKDAAEAGMTGAEFAAYVDQTQAARNEASGKMLDKTMRSIRAREQKRYKEAEATVREEISAEVDARPMFKALRLLKTGPMDDAWIRSEFGEDSVRLLPSRVPPVYKTGGIHPDIIAEQSGFDTGKQMVEALMGAELAHRQAKEGGDTRSMRERTISNEVDAVMQARYGDPLNDGSIEREALEAVHNDMQGDVIAAEIRVLARRTGKRPTPYAIAKDWARNKIRSGAVVDEASPSAIQRYARAAAKSANLAQEAMLKQDVDAAFKHKQAQMLNNALVSEAKAALDDVSSAVKRLEKIAKRKTMKSVDQEYLEQAQALLENVDMRRRSQVSVTRQGKFEAWANERQAEGHDVPVPPSFEATLGRTNWTRLSVENLLGLDEAVKHIIHLGRFKQTLLDNRERVDFNEKVDEGVQSAGNLRQKPPSDLMAPSYWDGVKSKILAADAALLKMETVFDWLDGGNSNGVFNRVVFRPIADAQENERKMLEETIGNLTDALAAVPNETLKRWGDKVETSLINRETGRPFVFTRDQLVSMALNVGNQSNLDKLTGGYNWQEGEVMSVLANELTQEEWTYVQSVWDTIESLWPQIEAMEKRINGVAPDKIVAQPVETPFGTLKGGYFPVVYDPRRNYDAEANAAKNSNIFEAIYTRASTPKGFTKERTAVERPIHLSLGIINRHVSEVIHDLTHREAIMQADKFLSNKRIMKAVDDTLGPEVRKLFRPWLQRIANEWAYDRAGNAGMEGFIKKLRLNTTIVGMGFRASTILMQAAGYSNSFERVGARWVAPRLKDVANPEAWRFVLENSKEVAARMESLDRDMRDNVKSAMGKTDWLTAPKRFAFHGIAYMDRVVVVPTWLGAYDKAIAGGMTEEDAIYAADKAVRQSQGSGAAKDLAAVQTGRGPAGEALKLLTMFYSYMSAFYQRQRNLGRDVRNASASDIPALMARAWWLLIVPPVLAELLAGRGPEDDEDWAAWGFEKIAFTTLGPIPLVRDVAPVAYAKATDDKTFGYRFTPAAGAMESVTAIAGDAGNIIEGEETKRATRNAIETVGYFTGLTTGQMATAAQFLVDVSYEEQDPETIGDWYEGLTTGKVKEKE